MISSDLANELEASFKASRLDISRQAALCVDMIEDAIGAIPDDARAKMEEKLLRGITREHIDQALEILRQDYQ